MDLDNLERILECIASSRKYKNIHKRTILEIVKMEASKYKKEKDLIKAVKSKLHQIYGAFLTEKDIRKINILLDSLEADKRIVRDISKDILLLHISTRERLEFYGALYREIFSITGKPKVILDLASGLNPYSIPWMNIEDPITYYAYDIDCLLIDSINRFFELIDLPKLAVVKDVIFEDVEEEGELCFIFKFLPTAERIKKGSSKRLLENIQAQFIVVSFPLKSISGREKGMLENYAVIFEPIFRDNYDIIKKFILGEEIFYILKKR